MLEDTKNRMIYNTHFLPLIEYSTYIFFWNGGASATVLDVRICLLPKVANGDNPPRPLEPSLNLRNYPLITLGSYLVLI